MRGWPGLARLKIPAAPAGFTGWNTGCRRHPPKPGVPLLTGSHTSTGRSRPWRGSFTHIGHFRRREQTPRILPSVQLLLGKDRTTGADGFGFQRLGNGALSSRVSLGHRRPNVRVRPIPGGRVTLSTYWFGTARPAQTPAREARGSGPSGCARRKQLGPDPGRSGEPAPRAGPDGRSRHLTQVRAATQQLQTKVRAEREE